ncbi:hypothetical protein DYB36_007754 [Aphanomyces astaci]|uniref:Uncharacterized protein n=2 Tax=Aphanomyces astaci TaxID=112090 RepID=A0A397AAR5_APHAT|nr:hypothetical protein DYB36_007754 [Aphanomyces astaci]
MVEKQGNSPAKPRNPAHLGEQSPLDPPPVQAIADDTDVAPAVPAPTDTRLDLVSVAEDEVLLSSRSDEECKSQPEPAQGTPVQKQLKRDINYRIQHHSNSPEQRDLEKRSKAAEDSDEAADTTSTTARRELASLLDDASDLSMEPRSSSEELVYTDDMAEASSDENKSDESMLTEGNDDETLTQSVVPFTSTSPIARLDSNDTYSSSSPTPGTLSLLTSDVQSATETIHHLAQVSTHAHGVPVLMESTHVVTTRTVQLNAEVQLTVARRSSPENYETSLVLDQTRSRFDSSSPTRLALPASDIVHETAVYNPALPFGLSPVAHVDPRSRTPPQLMDHVVSARPDESMGVEAITDHVEPSPLLDMVPIHQPIVERHQHLTVFEPDLPFGLAPVVRHDEPMEIDATDERPSLTMPPILTLDGPPPIRSIPDDFGEMETDDNSIMQATIESNLVASSPSSADLANLELRTSLQSFSDHVSAQVQTLRDSSLEHQAATTDLSHRVDETLSSTRAWQLAATDELVHLGNAVDTVAERNKTLTQDVSSIQVELQALDASVNLLRTSALAVSDPTAISANAQAISELHSSVQSQASATALLQTALHSYEDRVSREVERLSCDVQVLGRLLHEQLPAPPALSDDTRPCLEALRQENQLLHERVSSLVHDKTLLQDRVLLLETRIDQLSLDFSSRLAQASIPAPEPSSGYPFQLPSELTALLTKMSSEMADVKEAIDTSSSNQAFGRAVKYTTIPSSDAHDHCEYFMKQLVEQADRGGLTDDERKPLLGLKLSADKIVKGLPCSNAESDTPVQSHVSNTPTANSTRSPTA